MGSDMECTRCSGKEVEFIGYDNIAGKIYQCLECGHRFIMERMNNED